MRSSWRSFVLTLENLPMLFENNWLEFQFEHERT